MAGENYDWLTRGLEPEVRPEYLAQKRRNEALAAQTLAAEDEQRRLIDQLLQSNIQFAPGAISPELQAKIDQRIDELDPDELAGMRSEAEQAAYDAAQRAAQGYQSGGIVTGEDETSRLAGTAAASALYRQLMDKYGFTWPEEQLLPDFWKERALLDPVMAQNGGIVTQFGGQNMNGISMQTQPARRRIRREDMMGSGIGMGRPRNTFPVPSGRPIDRGISIGAPRPPFPGGNPPAPPPAGAGFTTQPAFIPQPPPTQAWTQPAYSRAPGPTDTVPAMLTPGEGVLNRGAMGLIGEGPVNALNRYGRGISMQGYEEGGKVKEDEDYAYPSFEETRYWTQADWDEWRRRHPRFEPSPTPAPEHHGGGGIAGRGGRERPVGGGGPGSRFRGEGGVDDQTRMSEWLERHGYPANWGAENRPPAGNPMPIDIPEAHDFPDLPEGGRISGGGRSWRSTLGERGGGMGLGGFGGFGSGYSGNWGRGLSSGQGGFGLGGPGQVEIGPMTGTPVPGFNWRPPLTGYLPSNPSQGMEEGGIVPGYAGGTGSVEVGGGGPHSSWGSGKPTRDWIGRIVGSASNLVFPGLGFATGPLSRWITQQIQSGKWGQQGTPSFIPSKPPQENAGAPPAVAPPISSGGRGGLGASFEQGGGIGGFQPLPGAGAGTPGMAGSLMLGQGQYWKPWLTRGYLPSNPSQGVATGGIVMENGVAPSFQDGGMVEERMNPLDTELERRRRLAGEAQERKRAYELEAERLLALLRQTQERPSIEINAGEPNPNRRSVLGLQEGGTVHPIGYTDPIEEAEWQKIVQMMPPNTDIAKLREQANQSGLSAATIAKLVGSMGSQFGAGGGFSSYAAPQYSMGDLAGGGGA